MRIAFILAMASIVLTGAAEASQHTTVKVKGVCSAGSQFSASVTIDPADDAVAPKMSVKDGRPDAGASCGYVCAGTGVGELTPCSTDDDGKLNFQATFTVVDGCVGLVPFIEFVGEQLCT